MLDRSERSCARARRQTLAAAGASLLVAPSLLLQHGAAGAGPAAVAAVVAGAFTLRWWSRACDHRRISLELIAQGGRDPRLDRERRRLLEPERRDRLACGLERLLGAARRGDRHTPVPIHRRTLVSVSSEIEALAQALRGGEGCDARGVALIELMLGHAGSPLYADRPDELRRQVGRARALLLGVGSPVR